MTFEEDITQIKTALAKGEFLNFFCNCSISYSGRAESYLDFGDRMIFVKQDSTLMIHQPEGGMPINYLKAPAKISFSLEKSDEGIPFVLCRAVSGEDEIHVEISTIYDIFSRRLVDGQKQDLSGNEKEMSDFIRDNPSVISSDFIPLSREEHTKYGFIDVFGHLGEGTLAIVEVKRYTAGLSAVTQLRRYVEKMQAVKGTKKVTGIIAAPAITANAMQMLSDWSFSFAMVEPPKRHLRKRREQCKIDSFF